MTGKKFPVATRRQGLEYSLGLVTMEVDIRDGLDITTRRLPLTYETHRTDVSRGDRSTRQRALVRHPKSDEERSDDLVDTMIRQLLPTLRCAK